MTLLLRRWALARAGASAEAAQAVQRRTGVGSTWSSVFSRLRVIAPAVLTITAFAKLGTAQSQPAATRAVSFRTTRAEAALEALGVTERGDERWWPICYGPCRVDLPPGLVLRVAGPRLNASSRFSLPQGDAAFEIQAQPHLAALWGTGVALTIIGGTTGAIGLVKYKLADLCSVDAYAPDPGCADKERRTAAIVMFAGAAALTAGVIMMVSNETKVDFGQTVQEPAVRLSNGLSLTPRGLAF